MTAAMSGAGGGSHAGDPDDRVVDHVIMVRAAHPRDLPEILRLMAPQVAAENLLPREEADVFRRLAEFLVAEDRPCGPAGRQGAPGPGRPMEYRGGPVGVAALHHYGSGLAEVRSLTVAESHAGNGVGRQLVAALLDRAREENLSRVIALTRSPGFFERLGFSRSEIGNLPEKVSRDCLFCPRRDHCDEVAMVVNL